MDVRGRSDGIEIYIGRNDKTSEYGCCSKKGIFDGKTLLWSNLII